MDSVTQNYVDAPSHVVFKCDEFHKQIPDNTKYVITKSGKVYNMLTGRKLEVHHEQDYGDYVFLGHRKRSVASLYKLTYES